MSDIEGKAVQGSSERVWEMNEFQVRRKNGARGTRDIEHVAIKGMELLGKAT